MLIKSMILITQEEEEDGREEDRLEVRVGVVEVFLYIISPTMR